jgi:hypothetical protein
MVGGEDDGLGDRPGLATGTAQRAAACAADVRQAVGYRD